MARAARFSCLRGAKHGTLLLPLLPLLLLIAAAEPTTRPAKERVIIAGEIFRLEPAMDEKSRVRGLSGREKIEDHGGMLFVFRDARRRSFWMNECRVDIDIVFVDDRSRITAVHKMKKEPPRAETESLRAYQRRLKLYPSVRPVRIAIELEAGSIDRLKLKVDQIIALDMPRLKKLAK